MVRKHLPESLTPPTRKKEASGSQKRKLKEIEQKKTEKLAESAKKFFKPLHSSTETTAGPSCAGVSGSDDDDEERNATQESQVDVEILSEPEDELVVGNQVPMEESQAQTEAVTQGHGPSQDSDNRNNEEPPSVDEPSKATEKVRGSGDHGLTYIISDPSTWKRPLTDLNLESLIEHGPQQAKLQDYPHVSGYRFSNDYFQNKKKNGEVNERDWLLYSCSTNSLFCFPCCLFGSLTFYSPFKNYGEGNVGFQDFKNKTRGLDDHESSHLHISNTAQWKFYLRRKANKQDIKSITEAAAQREESYWCKILTAVLDAILFLAKQNLAFQGSSSSMADPNCGNFLALIKLLGKYYAPLGIHNENHRHGRVSYLSNKIQNEFIQICAKTVRDKILLNINSRTYFSIMFDSTPDVTHCEQISQVIRTVACHKDRCYVEENFIDFISKSEKTGAGLASIILTKLEEDGLNMKHCVGQGYDNAASMAGIYNGVQAHILQKYSKAKFLPCAAHSLNRVGVNAAEKVLPAKLSLGKIQNFYMFFSASTSRWMYLKENCKFTLKYYSSTRWAAKQEAVSALYIQFPEIIETLIQMTTVDSNKFNAETIAEANSRLEDILRFDFLWSLTIWNRILHKINLCNVALQSTSCEVHKARNLLSGLLKWLEAFRIDGFETTKAAASEIAQKVGIEETTGFQNVRANRGRRRMRLEELTEDTELSPVKKFEVEFFNQLVDRLMHELRERFKVLDEVDGLFGFLFGKKLFELGSKETEKHVKDLCLEYPNEFDPVQFCNQAQFLKEGLTPFLPVGMEIEDTGPMEILSLLHKEDLVSAFSNVEMALRIFITFPTSVAPNERSFSKLKIIKNYLRNSSGQQRTSDLSLLSIEHELTDTISFEDVIKKFAKAKARKVDVFEAGHSLKAGPGPLEDKIEK